MEANFVLNGVDESDTRKEVWAFGVEGYHGNLFCLRTWPEGEEHFISDTADNFAEEVFTLRERDEVNEQNILELAQEWWKKETHGLMPTKVKIVKIFI